MRLIHHRGAARALGIVVGLAAVAGIAFAVLNVHTESKTSLSGTVSEPPLSVSPTPKPLDHFALNLSSAFNGFVGEAWKRENHDDDGIPGDGRVLVSGVVPRAFFQFVQPDEPNAIQLAAGTPVTVTIPGNQRGHYGRLAVLHGSQKGNVTVHATLHYDSGTDATEELRVQDWNRIDEAKETYVHKALKAGRVQLFSQIFKLDPSRTLENITFQSEGSAVIFALTVVVSGDRAFNGAIGVTVPSQQTKAMDKQ